MINKIQAPTNKQGNNSLIVIHCIILTMSEKFNLKWNDFHSNVSQTFVSLRKEDYLHDVKLVTDDNHQVSAHKLVLSACSEYFQSIFRNNEQQNMMLCLAGHENVFFCLGI